MLELIDLALFVILINVVGVIWLVLGYYYYKKAYLPQLETAEPDFAEGLKGLLDNLSTDISTAIANVKVDIPLDEISTQLTESFFGTFLAILGVAEEYNEDWSFRTYITQIIDASVETIVPETVKQFEQILPQFADQFVAGIQEALTGAIAGGEEGAQVPGMPQQAATGLPDMDISKMIQMYLLQYMVKSMGGGGSIGNLLGGLGGSTTPTSPGSSSF